MWNFFLGFFCMWFISGIVVVLTDECDFRRMWFDDFLVLPLFPVVPVFLFLRWALRLLFTPWRYVICPVSQEKFNESLDILKKGHLKQIGERLWFCYDKEAKSFYNRAFFVRVKKEK